MRNTRRLQVIVVALIAMFAMGVLTTASAFAAPEFLLAEWLVGGNKVETASSPIYSRKLAAAHSAGRSNARSTA
jgi:hypothetical protein